jgi:peptidoglycan/xylan/chitin deacetylase (PgdA/CDA1 family)
MAQRKMRDVVVPRKTYVLLTFDVENNWGDEERNCQQQNEEFFSRIREIRKSGMTFFVPGNLIGALAQKLKGVDEANEVGLHGYRHELWRSAYFVDKRPVGDQAKEAFLRKSLIEFQRYGLEKPVSFRAPYLWSKNSDLSILQKYGFEVDSSDPSFMGTFLPRTCGRIFKIPVTSHPFPSFKKKWLLLYAKYRYLNLKTLNDLSDNDFLEFIHQIVKLQVAKGSIPHLVFLIHPWEFHTEDQSEEDDNYFHRGPSNYSVLTDSLSLLEAEFAVDYVTAKRFREICFSKTPWD